MTATTPKKLDFDTQRVWLLQHIPHRVCASLTWLDVKGKWAMPPSPEWKDQVRDKFHIWCVGRSVDEGRIAAMRWLIEFVGVAMCNKTGNPKKPSPLPKHEDEQVLIERFDQGELFNLNHGDARILAQVWKGCSQASMHPTIDTKHPPIGNDKLAEALPIINDHLEKHLYEPNKLSLLEVLHDQEGRKLFPLP